MERIIW